jgi:hypothetical protein
VADCPNRDKTCDICGKTGHLKAKCRMAARAMEKTIVVPQGAHALCPPAKPLCYSTLGAGAGVERDGGELSCVPLLAPDALRSEDAPFARRLSVRVRRCG